MLLKLSCSNLLGTSPRFFYSLNTYQVCLGDDENEKEYVTKIKQTVAIFQDDR